MPKELISLYRDFKIKSLYTNFTIQEDRFKKIKSTGIYKLLESEFKEDIITGSLSLWLFGLLDFDRKVYDIDIITNKIISNLTFDDYGNISESLLGYKYYNYTKHIFFRTEIKVDFFENIGQDYIEYKGLKFNTPFNIIDFKMKMITDNQKHKNDLIYCFNSI